MARRQTLVWSARACALVGMLCAASPLFAQGVVTNLTVAGLSPAFSPAVTQYTAPQSTASCTMAVSVTLASPATDILYIQSNLTTSGAIRNAYVCGKTVDVIVYRNWKEMARYVVTPVPVAPPPPPPPPPGTVGAHG